MRIAVISDIHSNLHALESVQKAIEKEETDEVVCAGDIVGYGAFPNECCDIVKRIADHLVAGNHDLSALSEDTTQMNRNAAEAIRWTSGKLNDRSRSFLQSLKEAERFLLEGKEAALFHGSPKSVWEYVYEQDVSVQMVDSLGAGLMILGHTHVPYIRTFGDRFVLNPGAVGQPRDGDGRASFAVIDTKEGDVMIRRVDYDIDGAARAIEAAGLPEFLASRLYSGT